MFKPKIDARHIRADLLSGVVVGLVSIPTSMGYAQIAGLPAVYGLYGSLLPILLFAFLTSSPQFVVGVDAMPAVMVGSALTGMGLTLGSPEAVGLVPVISLLTGLWFLVFYALRLSRVVKYISTPVMGGFISGVGATIILMQLPKLFGGDAGTGELFSLLRHLIGELKHFNLPSALLGVGTVAVIQLSKKRWPKVPMSVLALAAGVALAALCPLERWGVRLLPETPAGLPRLLLPQLSLMRGRESSLITLSLTVALVVMAQTLLASNNYAMKYRYRIDTRRELLAYAAAELAGAAVGCCPVNGSVSRSGLADQFGCKSQLMSLTAAAVMLLVLLFGSSLLRLMPVPVLTGIVVSALIGILEIPLAQKLWRQNRREFMIFLAAFLGVLVLGTMGGVALGVALSFFAVVVRAVVPPTAFLGVVEGQDGFFNLSRVSRARPIADTVIYRFGGNLFFANIGAFQEQIEAALTPETRRVIVDGQGIGNIDMTAAERLIQFEEGLRLRGVRLYLTGHVGAVNDQLRQNGAGALLDSGCVRRTVADALLDAGLEPPYPLTGAETDAAEEGLAEFEWLYGAEAPAKLDALAAVIAGELSGAETISLAAAEQHSGFGAVGALDEDELLDDVEQRLTAMTASGAIPEQRRAAVEAHLEEARGRMERRLGRESPRRLHELRERRRQRRQKNL